MSSFTDEENLFIEFLESFSQFYIEAHKIAENTEGKTILPKENHQNEFKMYALDEICHSCEIFKESGVWFYPKTTDAIWYKKVGEIFSIFLIEFKGDFLCKTSSKCQLVSAVDSLKNKNKRLDYDITREINSLDKIISKYSDKMINGLAAKPLETITIALPLIYEEYYYKNKNNVDYLDIKSFLSKSRIIYRVVSLSENYEPNRERTRGRTFRCSNIISSKCKNLAYEKDDMGLRASYESSLQTYHRRYEKAGIVFSAGFVDNIAFNNFIENYLK